MVQLILNGQLADIDKGTSIVDNYQLDDFASPSTQIDSRSFSVALKATENNNRIFENIGYGDWAGNNFNPKAKIDYQLMNDGMLIEQGYAQLTSISIKSGVKTYNLTLYGGLGDFLYNLQYDSDGNKIKMSDLLSNLSFTINTNFLRECWAKTDFSGNTVKDWVNFAPCYNGTPDNFDADKIYVNATADGTFLPSQFTDDGTTYKPYNNYGIVELDDDATEFEVRDIRSYLQRPVVKLDKVIDRICSYSNYTVEKGNFFNDDNPYWSKTWIALPLLGDDLSSDEESSTQTLTGTTLIKNDSRSGEIALGYTDMSSMGYGVKQSHIVDVSLVIADNTGLSNAVYYSDMTTKDSSVKDYQLQWAGNRINFRLRQQDEYGNVIGYSDWTSLEGGGFIKTASGQYVFNGTVDFLTETEYYADKLYTYLEYQYVYSNVLAMGGTLRYVGKYMLYDNATYIMGNPKGYTNNLRLSVSDIIKTVYTEGVKSNSTITSDILWKTEETPAEILLSYCKMFNILMVKDPVEKKIKLLTRDEYFSDDVKELVVDEAKDRTITPYLYNTAYQRLSLSNPDDYFGELYNKHYSSIYGKYDVPTGYEFNRDVKSVISDNVFNNAITAKGISKYYRSFTYEDPNNRLPLMGWQVDGFTLKYFHQNNSGELEEGEKAMQLAPYSSVQWSTVDGCDSWEKMSFENDKKEKYKGLTLCFFNGLKGVKDLGGNYVKFFYSDDSVNMIKLNGGTPCWAWNNAGVYTYSLPSFSRYYKVNNSIIASLDFGRPNEIYFEGDYNNNTTIFSNYWESFYESTVDSQQLSCYIKIPPYTSADCLRYKWYYQGRYWRINKIQIDKLNNVAAKADLIRIEDVTDYAGNTSVVSDDVSYTISVSPTTVNMIYEGGSQSFTVTTDDPQGYAMDTPSVSWITKNSNTLITIKENTDTSSRSARLRFYCVSDNSKYIYVTINQQAASVTYSISASPASVNVESSGSSQTFAITTNDTNGFATSVVSGSDWITMSSNVAIISENTATSSRTGTIRFYCVSDMTKYAEVSVVQAAAVYTISVSPQYPTISSDGGVQNFTVTTDDPQGYTLDDFTYSWLTKTSDSSITVAENATHSQREAQLIFRCVSDTSKYIGAVITQEAAEIIYTISIDPEMFSAAAEGGSQTVEVTTTDPQGYGIKVSTDCADWVSNNGNVITVSENTDTSSRTGRVQFYCLGDENTYAYLAIWQAAAQSDPIYSISINTTTLGVDSSESEQIIDVATDDPQGYAVISDSDWAVWNTGSSSVTVSENTGASRTATLVFYCVSQATTNVTLTITQEAQPEAIYVTLDATEALVEAEGGSQTLATISTNDTSGVFASSDSDWITVPTGTLYDGDSLTVTIEENTDTTAAREATVGVTSNSDATVGALISVQQGAPAEYLTLSPSTLSFNATTASGSGSQRKLVTYATNSEKDIKVTNTNSWISIKSWSGNRYMITVQANTNAESRRGFVDFNLSGTDVNATLTIVQAGAGYTISTDPTEFNIDAAAYSATINVESNGSWTCSSGSDWLTYDPYSSYMYVETNFDETAREGTLTFTVTEDSSVQAVVTVVQEGEAVEEGGEEENPEDSEDPQP